jgi:hypothetical protein
MRDRVSETNLCVNRTHRVGERAASGHDQHGLAGGQLDRFCAPPTQAGQTILS